MKELELRHRIAADLHDEVGSSLSSIHMLSQIAAQQTGQPSKEKDILTRVSANARETMEKMSDIVWMIKPGESEGGNLKQRIEQFAYEIASNHNIDMVIDLAILEKEKLTMEQRRNIYLIFKEVLNNALKYSGTEKIEITSGEKGRFFFLRITDFGTGFELNQKYKGNGLGNMQKRARELKGSLDIQSKAGFGTTVELQVPL